MVSHNVEEIVELSDKIIVLSPRPGHVVGDLTVDLPQTEEQEIRGIFQLGRQSLLAACDLKGVMHNGDNSTPEDSLLVNVPNTCNACQRQGRAGARTWWRSLGDSGRQSMRLS